MISVEVSVAVDRMEDSVSLPDLRMSNIEGFSQKITMKMNRFSGEDGRDQRLRRDIFNPPIEILQQADVNAFMGT